ncbi:transcriptional regulator [Pseudomonas paralactis]|uniref:Transcriptional regulator n=1 Tax=Pseudomonas paralactis TaxID=1615673 RepID=A0ABS0UT32_9PSED|nr:transcriptional regulator [Pseudomonas paralactis]MBI6631187.1 transcriptional regulator [Pseudomonas paralactis]
MTTYNWDLIERLLHEVQNGEGSFAPRKYAEQEAAEKATAGEDTGNLDALKKTAADYEALLFKRGFIESRPEEEGGNGENFILTARGARLLALIDSSIPGYEHPRQVMDEQEDALDEATFDHVASKAAIAGGAI